MKVDHLPPLLSLSHAAKELGVPTSRMRQLVRRRRIGFVWLGERQMIPRDALPRFIEDNMVTPCPEETQDHDSDFSPSAVATTSPGPSQAARGSAARARRIAKSLKSRSPNSSDGKVEPEDRVIPLRSS
jgi:excisionase family DNA binding protein